ncbi:enoyl-CoA hydratase [compost metagenome]
MGLVNRVVSTDEIDDVVDQMVASFSALEPATVRRGKHAFNKISSVNLTEGLELARGMRPAFMCSEELRRGIEKFFAKKEVKA